MQSFWLVYVCAHSKSDVHQCDPKKFGERDLFYDTPSIANNDAEMKVDRRCLEPMHASIVRSCQYCQVACAEYLLRESSHATETGHWRHFEHDQRVVRPVILLYGTPFRHSSQPTARRTQPSYCVAIDAPLLTLRLHPTRHTTRI